MSAKKDNNAVQEELIQIIIAEHLKMIIGIPNSTNCIKK